MDYSESPNTQVTRHCILCGNAIHLESLDESAIVCETCAHAIFQAKKKIILSVFDESEDR